MARPIWTLAKARDEDTRGSVREVFDLAYPVVITQLSTTLMHAVDSAMVGRLGATQLAAVGFGGIWLWTLFSLSFGTATGVQTFVSQAHGAERPRESGPWVWQALYALIPASITVALIVALAVEPALALLGPSEALQLASLEYIVARLPGEVAFTATMVFVSFYRGLGDTRTPLYVTLFVNVVNAVLDYGLIFGKLGLPAWGVTGAGVATALSQFVGAVTLFCVFQRRAFSRRVATAHAAPDRRAIGRFLWTGAPTQGEAHARNAVFYGDKAIDRSPCGTGTSARMAQLAARGALGVGDDFVHESIIGSLFRGRVEVATTVGNRPGIVPSVEGWARLTGFNTIFIEDRDPYAHGFQVT